MVNTHSNPGGPPPLSNRKRILFTCTIGAIIFGICFLTMEAFVRVTRPNADLYQLTGRIPGPNPMQAWALIDAFSAYRGKTVRHNRKTINSQGFISTPEIAVKKPAGTRRVVFLGGSSTAGTGWALPDAETWPWITVDLLRASHPGVSFDFINGALGGYSSFESYGRLWSRLIHYSPDIVVLNHGWNEMYYFDKSDSITTWRTLKDGSWGFEQTTRPVPLYQPGPLDPLVRWSQLLTMVRLSWSTPGKGEIAPVSKKPLKHTYNRKGLDVWRTHLKLFRETCRALGIRLLVMKQPTLITADLPLPERRRCRYDFHGFDHDTHVSAFQGIYQVIDEEFPPNAIIETTSISGRPDYFFDHIHPSSAGAREIASVVSKALMNHFEADEKRP